MGPGKQLSVGAWGLNWEPALTEDVCVLKEGPEGGRTSI